jgi:hypothetical protein
MNTLKATLLVSLASTSLALAGTLTYDGDTTGQPVWNRPLAKRAAAARLH